MSHKSRIVTLPAFVDLFSPYTNAIDRPGSRSRLNLPSPQSWGLETQARRSKGRIRKPAVHPRGSGIHDLDTAY